MLIRRDEFFEIFVLLARMQFIVISRSFYSTSGYRSIRKMPKTMAKEEERYVKKKKRNANRTFMKEKRAREPDRFKKKKEIVRMRSIDEKSVKHDAPIK